MDIDIAIEQIEILNGNGAIQQLIAQGKSRYILYNVDELEENFPKYSLNLTERNNHTAYAYLTAACYIAENEKLSSAIDGLKKGASILEYNFKSSRDVSDYSDYFLLTVALANYAAFEYSKAFVSISELKYETKSAQLLSKFLSKKFQDLDKEISSIQINEVYLPENILQEKDEGRFTVDLKIYEYLLSKSLANVLMYFHYGNEEKIEEAIQIASDMMELLSQDEEPSMWWCIRLYRIILMGFRESAIWRILPPNFPGQESVTSLFIKNLANRKPVPIVEFFISQREAISKVVSESGLVVSLPTSSGKTRIAEVAILETLLKEDSIVLYIAPFRSLAYEVENTLETTFEPLGYAVSHLYGGASFGKVDRLEIENARIIIATPEKVKALFRVADDLVKKVKLVVLDEGHLLGAEPRFIKNEMFFEELRFHMEENRGKFIILSAVLPNPQHIAEWVTGKNDNIHENKWRPSSRRLGTLEFKGDNVNINWRNEDPETWNYSFVKPYKEGERIFPSNLKEAIAISAVKLSKNGSVLIFIAKGKFVNSQGKACLEVLNEINEDHKWNNPKAWKTFEMSIKNTLGYEDDVFKLANRGIICHQSKLPNNVKLAIENLMRSSNPKIIIATTTLAQGVNLGVSTVIIGDIWFGMPGSSNQVSKSKFWNIVGRAGRAFVDSEGKVLYAIDKNKKWYNIKWQEKLASEYLDSESHDDVYSGVLIILEKLSDIAQKASIDLGYLLELIAENSPELEAKGFSNNDIQNILEDFDFLDDTLLSLSYKNKSYEDDDVSDWIDSFFRSSLFFIQAKEIKEIDEESLLKYLQKRNSIITDQIGNPVKWLSHIRTGIPIRASITLESLLDKFEEAYFNYILTDQTIDDLSNLIQNLETLIGQLPGNTFEKTTVFSNTPISDIRHKAVHELWLSGESHLSIVKATTKTIANHFCSSYFGYTLPWVFNALSRKFNLIEKRECADFYENLATIVELGLPNVTAIKNYLGGVNSRPIATEISRIIQVPNEDLNISEHLDFLIGAKDEYINQLSDDAIEWLEVIENRQLAKNKKSINFPTFTVDLLEKDKIYSVKIYNDSSYLCSSDYTSQVPVQSTKEFPFKNLGHKLGYYFKYDTYNEYWELSQ